MNIDFQPEVIRLSYAESPVLVSVHGYTGGESGKTAYLEFYNSSGKVITLNEKDIQKLADAMRDWGFTERL